MTGKPVRRISLISTLFLFALLSNMATGQDVGARQFPDSVLRAPAWSGFQDITRAFAATPDPKIFLNEVRARNEDLAETLLLFMSTLKEPGDQAADMQRIYSHYVINTDGGLPKDEDQDAFDVVKWVTDYADSLQIEISRDRKHVIRGEKEFSWSWDYEPGSSASRSLRRAGHTLNRCRYGRNDVIPSTLFLFDEDALGHTRPNAMWMAELSALVYHDKDYVKKQLKSWGFGDFRWITSPESQNTDTVAFVATGLNHLVVSFRGTSSFENLVTDLTFSKMPSPFGQGKVHRGFMEAYASVQIAINKAVTELGQGRAVFVTGHSLGAALAQLAAYDLAASGKDVDAVYVFGSPRLGDEDFARAYNWRLEDRTYLHINNKDLVTRVPPGWFRFRSLGKPANQFVFDADHGLANDPVPEDPAPDSIRYDRDGEVVLTDDVRQQLQENNQSIRNVIENTTLYLESPVNLYAPSYQTTFDTGPADDHGINQYLFKFACSIVDDQWSRL